MSKIFFKIDEKALYYGIYNDYQSGETMTSSTPINQSKNPSKHHKDIIQFIESDLDYKKRLPDGLLRQCTRKTTSQAKTRINNFFIFNKILIDGKKLNTNFSFAIYVKEEIDEWIIKRNGVRAKNTHLGRKKLHNPSNLKYVCDGFNINNKQILEDILSQNGGFAYIVRGFEVDTEEKTLNFITSIIGIKGILLSSVFKKKKGIGKKLLIDEINLEAQDFAEIDENVLIKKDWKSGDPNNLDYLEVQKTSTENGKKGEEYVWANLERLIKQHPNSPFHTSKEFPSSPYDIEFIDDSGIKQYVEVKSTQGNKKVFNMSSGEIRFMETYKQTYLLILVTNVTSSLPTVSTYCYSDIKKMRSVNAKVRFYVD